MKCPNKNERGVCTQHNLHCGFPKCEEDETPVPTFEREVSRMGVDELRQRVLAQSSHIKAFAACLDGLKVEGSAGRNWRIPGVDGSRAPRDIRRAMTEVLVALQRANNQAENFERLMYLAQQEEELRDKQEPKAVGYHRGYPMVRMPLASEVAK